MAVSGVATPTRSKGMASTSAAIWARTARAPCPISTVLARTVALPSACRRTIASDTVGPMLAFIIIATPRPRSAAAAWVQRIASAARVKLSSNLPSMGVSPGANSSPWARRFCRRSSTGIQIEAPRRVVEQRLEGPGELRHAEAPEGAARCRVRVDGPARQHDVRDAVRAGGGIGALLDDARPDVGVGAHVEVGAALGGPELTVALQSELDAHAGIAAADGAEGVLRGDRQPHRSAGHARERARDGLDLRVGLAAEAPAEERHDDANPVERHAEHRGELDPHGVRILRGGPDGEAALLVPGGQRAVGLHGIVLHAREGVAVLEDEVGLGEGAGAAPALEVELVADVGARDGPEGREIGEVAGQGLARVDERRAGRQRLLDRGDGGEGLVVDVDPLERLAGRGLVLGDRRGHRLALVAHHVDGEDGAVAEGGAEVRVAPVEVGAA